MHNPTIQRLATIPHQFQNHLLRKNPRLEQLSLLGQELCLSKSSCHQGLSTLSNNKVLLQAIHARSSRLVPSGFRHQNPHSSIQALQGHPCSRRSFSATLQSANMSSDSSYLSFLNKANEDPKSGTDPSSSSKQSTSEHKSKLDPTTQSSFPESLQSIPDSLTYTSDTDSAFEPIFLNYAGADLPSIDEFKKVLEASRSAGKDSVVEELTVKDFDPRGQYKEIVDRVKKAGSGDVKVFRVEVGATRVEYYIVTIGDRSLVGVVTKAVES
ncbi:hypothetical protein PV10_00888 [Exophiala mesophila]|uniref:Uncharacterized protein n=1 Tax=Exophiala mesophila TaxID=212818 RepID=A0A0D1Y8W8_EXOME|nr:uncharacterized protein PV10_00888 [Exophiala mesophila]KIV97096.1 hypothetical protein PV10_00888 [Exophiala mesophila]